MSKKPPTSPEGWTYAGAAGLFTVWRAGNCDYRVTQGPDGNVICRKQHFQDAHVFARRSLDISNTRSTAN